MPRLFKMTIEKWQKKAENIYKSKCKKVNVVQAQYETGLALLNSYTKHKIVHPNRTHRAAIGELVESIKEDFRNKTIQGIVDKLDDFIINNTIKDNGDFYNLCVALTVFKTEHQSDKFKEPPPELRNLGPSV